MGTLGTRYTSEEIAVIIKQFDGNISAAANKIGVNRATVHAWVKRDSIIADAVNDAREGIVDIAETQLKKAVLKGERWAVMFTLSTIGKERGYNRDKKSLPDLERLLDSLSEDLADEIRRAIGQSVPDRDDKQD